VLYVTGDGTVTLDGTLVLNFIDGFTPEQAGDTIFNLISAPDFTGQFIKVDIYQDGVYQYTNGDGDPLHPTLTVGFVIQEFYNFTGFFPPVDNTPALNLAKAGSAIPVKFSLSGNKGLAIFATGYPKAQQIACDTSATLDEIEQTVSAGGSSLSYDPVTDQYTYVWKTEKAWSGTCRQLQVKLSDGNPHVANFKFK
jgi:hypothetical protein